MDEVFDLAGDVSVQFTAAEMGFGGGKSSQFAASKEVSQNFFNLMLICRSILSIAHPMQNSQ